MTPAQLINQTSGACEYFSPQPIIKAARAVMGGIDLDPASSAQANKRIGASRFFGLQFEGSWFDGMAEKWSGRVWMNHPFGRAEKACSLSCHKEHEHHDRDWHGNAAWINKLVSEFESGRVTGACCITYACTSEAWFRPLLQCVQCFLVPRTNYLLPDGTVKKGVTKGSVVTYFGSDPDKFAAAFADLGIVKDAWSYVSVT